MKHKKYYDYIKNQEQNHLESSEIKSDFSLILKILKEILIFILMIIPNLLFGVMNLLIGNTQRSSEYFTKIISLPFKLLKEINEWFFQAKITAYLIITLLLSFIFQILFINSSEILSNSLRTHTSHIFEGNYYSLFTSIFLHGDIIHLLTNCLALLVFGRIVEKQFKNKMLIIFLSSGVIANILSNSISYFLNDQYYSLGASGAIAGLIIFAILLEPFALSTVFVFPLPIFIIGWFLISLDLIGITNPSQINHLAHLSGYSALLFIFFFLEIKNRKKIILGFSINLILILILYILSKIFDFTKIINLN